MSFLTRTTLRTASRAQFISATTPRVFSTSFVTRKSATEAVKDTVKTVDRAVSDKLVDGIELSRMSSFPSLPSPPFLSSRFLWQHFLSNQL